MQNVVIGMSQTLDQIRWTSRGVGTDIDDVHSEELDIFLATSGRAGEA